MYENVTVDKAIAKGIRMTYYPVILIMSGAIGLGTYFSMTGYVQLEIYRAIGLFIVFGILVSWFYISIAIKEWRSWAFSNVMDVRELRKRAIKANLMTEDSAYFEKYVLQNLKEKDKRELHESKLQAAPPFQDDPSIPGETLIYFVKSYKLIRIGACIVFVTLWMWIGLMTHEYIKSIVYILIGGLVLYWTWDEFVDTTPQIIINNKGIKTPNTYFINWEHIKYEEVVSGFRGKIYLSYEYPNGSEYFSLHELRVDEAELTKLLTIYRGRNRKNSLFAELGGVTLRLAWVTQKKGLPPLRFRNSLGTISRDVLCPYC